MIVVLLLAVWFWLSFQLGLAIGHLLFSDCCSLSRASHDNGG